MGTEAKYSPEFLARTLGKFAPTEQQRQVIEAPFEPLLVVAGAGAGKTSTITDRIVWMVANGFVRPENILGVTFTRKAAGELTARVRQQLMLLQRAGVELVDSGHGPDDEDMPAEAGRQDFGEPQISTYHAYAHSIVSDYGVYIGVEPDSLLMSPAAAWQLARSVVEDYDGDYAHFTAGSATLIQAVISLSAECSEHLVPIDRVRSYVAESLAYLESLPQEQGKKKNPTVRARKIIDGFRTRATLTDFVAEYQRIKAEQSLLDYGDLIVHAARIATEVPHAVRAERGKYRVVILDEFQDTSVAQLQLFSALFGDGHAVTAVGDPQQSIYGFRGASAAGLYSFVNKFPRYDGEKAFPSDVKYLLTSWRNSRAILEVANQLAKPLATPQYPVKALDTAPHAGAGAVSINFYAQDSSSSDASSEADAVAAEVKKIQHDGLRAVVKSPEKPVDNEQPPSIAVLCRRRSQFAALQSAFDKYGVAYEVIGLGGLLRTPEVIDLVSMLRIVADPLRSDSMMRIISGARFRLGASDLMVLSEWARAKAYGPSQELGEFVSESFDDVSLVDVLDNLPGTQWVSISGRSLSGEAHRRLTRLDKDIKYLRGLDAHDLMMLIDETEKTMLLDIEVASKPGVDIRRARANLDSFKNAAFDFIRQGTIVQSVTAEGSGGFGWGKQRTASSPPADLTLFLSWIDAVSEQENGLDMPPQPVRSGVAQLMTVHASKGLEWDAVFVPGLAQGIFPSDRSVSWTGADPGSLPWPLRGDYGAMKLWDWDLKQEDLKSVETAWDEHRRNSKYYAQGEERRLAYVAVTRAKSYLCLSASAWNGNTSRPKKASDYLAETARMAYNYGEYADFISSTPRLADDDPEYLAPSGGASVPAITIGFWENDISDKNPRENDPTVSWPVDPLGSRRAKVEKAADNVKTFLRYGSEELSSYVKENEGGLADVASYGQLELLLGQAIGRRSQKRYVPEHIPASTIVSLGEDAEAIVSQWQRPMPSPPSKAARFGTLFHRWVEDYLTSDIPLDIEIPEFKAAADAGLDTIFDIGIMKENFLNSPWAYKQAYAVEEPIETKISSMVVRGKIDAVYRERQKDGTYAWEIVDWKTGAVPDGNGELARKAVQLALYRLAYSRIHNIAPEKISAAFYYVRHNKIFRPMLVGEKELIRLIEEAVGSDKTVRAAS